MKGLKYCYGPVGSWRLGASLGIDPISQPEKICTFDCVYCQLGPCPAAAPCREVYVRPEELGAASREISAELAGRGAGAIRVINVYGEKAPKVAAVSAPDTLKRRGKT